MLYEVKIQSPKKWEKYLHLIFGKGLRTLIYRNYKSVRKK